MLKYVGDGSAWPGIPARDLIDAEVIQHGKDFLLSLGLYVEAQPHPAEHPTDAPAPAAEDEK